MICLLLSFVCWPGGEEPLDLPAEGRVAQLRRLLPIQRQHRQSSHGSLVLFNILIMATVMLKCFMFCASIKVQKNLESSHHSGTCLCCKIQLLCWTMCKSLLKFLELCICGLNPPVCYFSVFDIIIWTFCIFKFCQHIKYWYPFKMFWYQRLWVCLFCPWIIYIPVTFKIRGCLY